MNFRINDKVKLKGSGEVGTVSMVFIDTEKNKNAYKVIFADSSCAIYEEEELLPVSESVDLNLFDFEITLDNNIAIVRAKYNGKEIAHNHGHIFRDGKCGVLQAVSYAFRRMWESIEEQDVK